jgi:hypothetical protein
MAEMENDVQGRIEQLENVIKEFLEARLKHIPDVIKDLIPEDLKPEEKLAWLDKQEKKGLFRVVQPAMMTPGKELGTGPYTGPGTAPGTGPGTEIMGANEMQYPQWVPQSEEQPAEENPDYEDPLLTLLDEIDDEDAEIENGLEMDDFEEDATKAQIKQANRNTL